MPRKPARETYDAQVDLEPVEKGGIARYAYALVKTTYRIGAGPARLAEPEPLLLDFWHDETLDPKLPPGSDFWPHKNATDVVVRGSAWAPEGKPRRSMEVQLSIGRASKRVAVFGRREVGWASGAPRAETPEPFMEMPLVYSNAYGGLDPRVPIPAEKRDEYMALAENGLAFDHPGGYPRNLGGKGYLVLPDRIAGLEMPNLENPEDLLTSERLVVKSPELWHRQPLPWCFEWTDPLMYPRLLFLHADTWFPCRDPKALPEVRAGYLAPEALDWIRQREELHPDYYQEASFGMVVRSPLAGQPVVVAGMNPAEPVLRFSVPGDPTIDFNIEGRVSPAKPTLTNFVIRPAEGLFTVVYCAKMPLPRAFIPEIHKTIPISIRVNQDRPIVFETPPTIRDRLQAAAEGAGKEDPRPPS